ncbi:hypothetical protein [Mucilaginibacter sp.]
MQSKLLTIVFILSCSLSYSQELIKPDSTIYYINNLNENSCSRLNGTYATSFVLDNNAKRIIGINDNQKITKLIANLKVPDKFNAINYILNQLIKPKNQSDSCDCYIPSLTKPKVATDKPISIIDSSLNLYSNFLKHPSANYVNCIYNYWVSQINIK